MIFYMDMKKIIKDLLDDVALDEELYIGDGMFYDQEIEQRLDEAVEHCRLVPNSNKKEDKINDRTRKK